MKTLVIYYSYTGKTRQIATELAQRENAALVEVKETKSRSKVGAYLFGSFAAMRRQAVKLQDYACDVAQYDKIIIAMPIWAGYPAPAMNAVVQSLPSGKEVALVMTSGSGNSSRSAEATKQLIANRGCTVLNYTDIKS